MTDKDQSEPVLEQDLIPKVIEVEYHVMSLGAFLRCVRYRQNECLPCLWMVSGCGDGGALLYVPLGSTKSWYKLGICQLMRNMEVDRAFALVAIEQLKENDWKTFENHEWLPYNYDEGMIMVLPAELPLVHRSISCTKVREGGQLEVKPLYSEEFANSWMSMEYSRLARSRYLIDGTDVTSIPTLQEEDPLSKPARLIANAAVPNVEVQEER